MEPPRHRCRPGIRRRIRGRKVPPTSPTVSPTQRLEELVGRLKTHYGANPVVLVDEYDAPLVHLLGKDAHPEPILDILRNFYVKLKSLEYDLHFVFVTGIIRFARVSLFSAFNNLWDISWEPAYAILCGFTEQAVRTRTTFSPCHRRGPPQRIP